MGEESPLQVFGPNGAAAGRRPLVTSNVFLQGHWIRLQISASFTPNFSRNLQSGESEVNSAEMKRAHVHIFHDTTHPSQVVLPLFPLCRLLTGVV
jgi:predicted acyl esterase